ncbi:APC family permease [Herbiconiux sp. KACC 21604]|uniref:APC family permease n=1 Tax=unclassified Herbiconiux TaxID=2618217 RepID=UPI001491C378|nr:APC family permease [Herbiconiux sp. SALV-R1]QJU55406.1 APC family permease [Herbiconiux sp. SALV-R1]WPO86581.1 APC family permease [Herbiconiux sp. KACC 21604]
MTAATPPSPPPSPPPALERRLGLTDAVFIGLGAMIGAGVFSVFAPAAASAGGAAALLGALGIAAVVAYCNATSTAQLAARYPTAGGSYVYGRERLGEWWGFAAGWSFVIGKTASCAAMALTFAVYALPPGAEAFERPLAALAVAALVGVNLFGITRTALAARVIVVAVLVVLAIVVASGVTDALAGPVVAAGSSPEPAVLSAPLSSVTPYGILQAAGLLFFAFAGYARIATLGEEVKHPERTIPRAVTLAFVIALAVYAAIAVVAVATLGASGLASAADPLAQVVSTNGWGWAVPVVGVGAALASLGALLALVTGVGRTALAMGRQGDLPRLLGVVDAHRSVPRRAELAVGVVIVALVLTVDLRGVIAFSSFGVLLYYFVANVSAFGQRGSERRSPRVVQLVGAAGCVVLVAALPSTAVVVGVVVVAVGFGYRAIRLGLERARPTPPSAR